ncbi:MAG TPA: HD domain-containing protein [Pirellulaceae bacterium]|mgnify:CR=1 FL=1|nr:HD domain-containing protein [Pirellulaceae bacterium]HMO93944.1 HD domain-containing protein [Pirellulaceae bacterium]HMP69745.1 HD domain-containing protein [Pirellulaceae bacterium]
MKFTNLLRALEFAAIKHCLQRRKSGSDVPYINHPIKVARLLAEVAGVEDETVLLAAILHDTLEDTDTTAQELEAEFGSCVRAMVEEVTDDKQLPRAQRKQLQIEHAPHLSTGAALIKLADKICNVTDLSLSPPPEWTTERRRQYLIWAEMVVQALPPVNEALETKFYEELHAGRQCLAN